MGLNLYPDLNLDWESMNGILSKILDTEISFSPISREREREREKKEKEKGNLIDRERKQRHRGGEGLLRVLVRSKKK